MTDQTGLGHYLRETSEWRATIGKAIVSFGEIELVTYQCLAHLPEEKIQETASRQGFVFRVDLIVEILEGRRNKSEEVASFIDMLKRARELARTRNDLAHNTAMLSVFEDKISEDLAVKHCVSTARRGRVIDLADARKFADEVESLAA